MHVDKNGCVSAGIVSLAHKSLKKQCKIYNRSIDAELDEKMNKALQRARITLSEYNLLQGLLAHDLDHAGGVSEINSVVEKFTHKEEVIIRPSKDLHRALWRFSQNMTKGKSFTD